MAEESIRPTMMSLVNLFRSVNYGVHIYIYIPICSMYGIFTYIWVWKYDEICPFSIDIYGISIAGWWFQTWILFSIIWMDNPSHWLSYYSRLLKPPTSIFVQIFFNVFIHILVRMFLKLPCSFFEDDYMRYIYICIHTIYSYHII